MAVTPRPGNYSTQGPGGNSPKRGAWTGNVALPASSGGVVNNIYKNQGWYAAGSAFEIWITSPYPTTAPPSGHTLTDIQHQLLFGT